MFETIYHSEYGLYLYLRVTVFKHNHDQNCIYVKLGLFIVELPKDGH